MIASLAFTAPWMLAALAALPLLWLLLRLIPPRPQRFDFPPLRLLLDLAPRRRTAARAPWWLVLLRLLLAAAVIGMLAGPVLRPSGEAAQRGGPLLLLVDNGWAAGPQWSLRKDILAAALDNAAQAGRPVALAALADPVADLSLSRPEALRERVSALQPEPWQADRGAFAGAVAAFLKAEPGAEIAWFSDGLAGPGDGPFLALLAAAAARERPVAIYRDPAHSALALAGANNAPDGIDVRVLRAGDGGPAAGTVRALDLRGLPIGHAAFAFAAGKGETSAHFDLPVDLRNDIARLEIVGESSAGAVQLLDRNWRRRVVGVVSGQDKDVSQPLLSMNYFLSRALQPFADVRLAEGTSPGEAIDRFLDQKLPMLILADVGNLGEAEDKLAGWIEGGGILVRFAGSRLAAADDRLLPVKLRDGERTLGGALSWEKPQKLGSFAENSPFAGLAVPDDVSVTRQLLAEPDIDLPGKTWATLADGTPLVTAEKRGKGMIVLFHVTADTTWSNLALSGTFVEMLRRIVGLANAAPPAGSDGPGAEGQAQATGEASPVFVAPSRTLDGFGAFSSPPATAQPVRADRPGTGRPDHPPGFYGPPDGLIAVNALAPNATLKPLDLAGVGAQLQPYARTSPIVIGPMLLVLALALLMIDALAVFAMAGGWARLRRPGGGAAGAGTAAALALVLAFAAPHRAEAQARPFDSALKTHLAYIVTGDKETDDVSLAGLKGLSAYIAERTALEPGAPVGLDPARDELAFYALIYWPVVPDLPPPPPAAMARIDAFMKSGGTIIFDTRDAVQQDAGQSTTPAGEALKRLLSSLDIPELEPVPPKHVLTKTFYLLDKFPGRYDNGETWVQATPQTPEDSDRLVLGGDGVSPIIITSNDLAGAWAVGPDMNPIFPVSSGSERQRELAYRAGVNMVMYALTGNYKADQVHVQDLLERLGR
ncbi:DUF4159 domain-containing protein [Labrys monachus]|uniref:DUF4159 domain-containing protein n=1 Tax=Labrys monachus TaxID=217067 RepID=A0ABU0FK25_9HYPH|nr:DUF4159 domain-containing protein [Labrys monachus]MDQ0394697.1 hypothetical protein [Labrys monachus]